MTAWESSDSRQSALARANARPVRRFTRRLGTDGMPLRTSDFFGCNTFSFDQMAKKITPAELRVLRDFATRREALPHDIAENVAKAVKEWAISRGCTHYSHWFQPKTGATAEKHDAFLVFNSAGDAIEHFTAKQLVQSEPDASSFPSGGRRTTFEARGYAVWDASSPMFLMEQDNGVTLSIPSLFISYNGEALDLKTPLLRSLQTLSEASVEALHLLGASEAEHAVVLAGPEQEYFVIDESLCALRPDLVLTGRALLGREPSRGQRLEDHYFGTIKPRILAYMMECEYELYKLGVPCKTRHNEVAPSQFEIAPIHEAANVAADHNQLVMEVLKSVARRHNLVTLFHEKPFHGVNGSGKHLNWSIADSSGHNLLEPGESPLENLRFLYFLAATVKAIHDNGDLLRAAIASPGNDFRLGANEAPPAIMSVFLGETLTEIFEHIGGSAKVPLRERQREIHLDLARVPVIHRDNTDRNRTSPFAFTGNKFEFRAVGSSASISTAMTYLNAVVAHSLREMNKRLAVRVNDGRTPELRALEIISEVINETRSILFEGNNYSEEWQAEAAKRGLPNTKTTPEALRVMVREDKIKILADLKILSADETRARYMVGLERYNKTRQIELETLLEMVASQVLPAAVKQLDIYARAKAALREIGGADNFAELRELGELTARLSAETQKLRSLLERCASQHDEEALGKTLATEGDALLASLRNTANGIELLVDDRLWPLPKCREMLHSC